MQYFISFLEGIITFVSPCLLPMLPVYVSYFAGGFEKNPGKAMKNALGFILGFTFVFILMGALAGTFGKFLNKYHILLNLITGLTVVFFGLNYLGVFRLNIFKGTSFSKRENPGFFSSVLFGMVFSIGWTPCVGVFLGSALMLAANRASLGEGVMMLLSYSLGLGIPFFISAILIDKLKNTFSLIKKHFRAINIISGGLLVIVGIMMATGLFGSLLALLS